MNGLVEFLRARLDEDEQAARALAEFPTPWAVDIAVIAGQGGRLAVISDGGEGEVLCDFHKGDRPLAEHIVRHDPARVLAEVEAKRRILGSHRDYHGVCPRCFDWRNKPVEREPWPCEVARLLALPYASHPDYREEWKP